MRHARGGYAPPLLVWTALAENTLFLLPLCPPHRPHRFQPQAFQCEPRMGGARRRGRQGKPTVAAPRSPPALPGCAPARTERRRLLALGPSHASGQNRHFHSRFLVGNSVAASDLAVEAKSVGLCAQWHTPPTARCTFKVLARQVPYLGDSSACTGEKRRRAELKSMAVLRPRAKAQGPQNGDKLVKMTLPLGERLPLLPQVGCRCVVPSKAEPFASRIVVAAI